MKSFPFGFFAVLAIQATTITTAAADNNNDENINIVFPSVFTLHIPQSQILTTEVLGDLDLLDFDCISNRDRELETDNNNNNNNGDKDNDPICTVYSLIHSQHELDYIQSNFLSSSSSTTSKSTSGLVLEYDAESTEVVTKREKRKSSQEQGDDGTVNKSSSGYSTIEGHSCFLDIDGMSAWLEDFVQTAPSYLDVSLVNIGESYQKSVGQPGYNIQALRVTAKPSSEAAATTTTTKAPMLVLTGVHAREYSPPEMMRRWIEHITTTEYSDDIRTMLESTEIHWIPYVNPDGRKLAETTQPWRRKNVNPSADDSCDSDEVGVDVNRNFPMWYNVGSGSSGYGCSQSYRGSGPMSEPETKAVVEYAKSIYPESQRKSDSHDFGSSGASGYDEQTTTGVFLDIHAHGNIYIYPWGYRNSETPNQKALFAMVSKLNHFTDYEPSGPGNGFTYPAAGATDDFAFGKLGAAAMTWELGDSFHQNCNRFESTIVPDNIEALTYAATVAYRPYSMAQGPDVTSFSVEPSVVNVGDDVQITVSASDSALAGLSNTAADQQIQEIRIYIGQHPFSEGNIPTPDLVLDESLSDGEISATLSTIGFAVGSIQVYAQAVDTDGYAGPLAGFTLTVSDAGGPPPTASPTLRGTPSPTIQSTPQPTPQPTTSNNSACTEMVLEVHADGWGYEISVIFFDGDGNTVFSQEGLESSVVTTFTENCVDMVDQCSLLRISDSYGDGLIDGGKFILYLNGEVYMEGSDYGEGMEIRLGLPCTKIVG